MSTKTTPASYLLGLPMPIQEHLVTIARRAVGMSESEKAYAVVALARFAQHFALRPMTEENELFIPAADVAADLSSLIRQAQDCATEHKETRHARQT